MPANEKLLAGNSANQRFCHDTFFNVLTGLHVSVIFDSLSITCHAIKILHHLNTFLRHFLIP